MLERRELAEAQVGDLEASKAFYIALGFVYNSQFSDDTAAFMKLSESIDVVLLTHAKWRTFTTRQIPPKTSSELASENGGTADINPVQDHGFMYGRDLADPDGHVWGDVDGHVHATVKLTTPRR